MTKRHVVKGSEVLEALNKVEGALNNLLKLINREVQINGEKDQLFWGLDEIFHHKLVSLIEGSREATARSFLEYMSGSSRLLAEYIEKNGDFDLRTRLKEIRIREATERAAMETENGISKEEKAQQEAIAQVMQEICKQKRDELIHAFKVRYGQDKMSQAFAIYNAITKDGKISLGLQEYDIEVTFGWVHMKGYPSLPCTEFHCRTVGLTGTVVAYVVWNQGIIPNYEGYLFTTKSTFVYNFVVDPINFVQVDMDLGKIEELFRQHLVSMIQAETKRLQDVFNNIVG